MNLSQNAAVVRGMRLLFVAAAAVAIEFALPTAFAAAANPERRTLSVTVQPFKGEFAPHDEQWFTITFQNQTSNNVALRMRHYLGTMTLGSGEYEYEIKNRLTGEAWTVAPAHDPRPIILLPELIETVTLGPGTSRETRVKLPPVGTAFFVIGAKQPAPPQWTLPPGTYRVTIRFGGVDAAPASAEFTVSDGSHAGQESQAVPLQSVYSSSRQPGLQHANLGNSLLKIPNPNNGPAIVGFAWAKDFPQLQKLPLVQPPAEGHEPVALVHPAEPQAQLWAVVYAGSTGSQPPQWLLESVTLSRDNVWEVVYHHAKSDVMTDDLFPYVAFIPLRIQATRPGSHKMRLVLKGTDSHGGKTVVEQAWTVEAPGTSSGAQPGAGSETPGTALPGSTAGKCVDTSGNPLAGVTVTVQQGDDAAQTVGQAISAKDGAFKIENLPAGKFLLIAVKQKPMTFFDLPTINGQPNPNLLLHSQKLAINSGKCTDVGSIILRPVGQLQHEETPTGRVSGKAVDKDGKPLAGVSVVLQENAEYQATSEGDGSFTIGKLPPGEYMLVAGKRQNHQMLLESAHVQDCEGREDRPGQRRPHPIEGVDGTMESGRLKAVSESPPSTSTQLDRDSTDFHFPVADFVNGVFNISMM